MSRARDDETDRRHGPMRAFVALRECHQKRDGRVYFLAELECGHVVTQEVSVARAVYRCLDCRGRL